jgi:aryl-alcohol dehydrogenase-like predicted oxidoreductase
MEYTELGRTGLKVSRICLGCMSFGSKTWREWVLEEEESRPIIQAALEAGVNFFDTANMYSLGVSEEITGRALHDLTRREDVIIATKVFFPMSEEPGDRGLSRRHIMEQAEASLRRLGTDYIDLYQIHRWDYETPIEETLEALDDLVRQGKVRHLGASSMWAHQFARALHLSERNGWARFETMQNHYNLLYREEEREMNPLCVTEGVALIPWSPLARGLLTGTRSRSRPEPTVRARTDDYSRKVYTPEVDFEVVERLLEVAGERGDHPAAVALAWLLHKPGVVAPIVGTTRLEHLQPAFEAVDLILSEDELRRLEACYRPHAVQGHS